MVAWGRCERKIGLGNSGRFGSVSVWKSRWEDGFLWDLWWDRCDGGGRHGVAVKTFFGGMKSMIVCWNKKGAPRICPKGEIAARAGRICPERGDSPRPALERSGVSGYGCRGFAFLKKSC